MTIPALVTPISGNRYVAVVSMPFEASAEGDTREEALAKLQDEIARRLTAGAAIMPVQVPDGEHPWARFAGMLRDEPLFEEWQKAIADRRREMDEDDDVL